MINDFEKLLYRQNNTHILKFFLHITPEEQLERFKQRLDDPTRNWKISDSDYKEREYWDAYTKAFEDAFEKTSTKHAPWYIVPSNHKWFRNLAVSKIVAATMEDLEMQLPKPQVDLASSAGSITRPLKREVAARLEASLGLTTSAGKKETQRQGQEEQEEVGRTRVNWVWNRVGERGESACPMFRRFWPGFRMNSNR